MQSSDRLDRMDAFLERIIAVQDQQQSIENLLKGQAAQQLSLNRLVEGQLG
jgi:hypothetical protein